MCGNGHIWDVWFLDASNNKVRKIGPAAGRGGHLERDLGGGEVPEEGEEVGQSLAWANWVC